VEDYVKANQLVPVVCLAVSTAAFAQVTLTVNEPLTGKTYTSPVTVSATASSPNGPSGWTVYQDSILVVSNTDTSGRLDATFPSSPGSHTIVVKAWDNSGANTPATETITVNSSSLPTPPGNAISYPNLQNTAGNPGTWTICDGGCAGSQSGATGTDGFSFGVASPSLSGAAMKFFSTSTHNGLEWNSLGYRHLGCPSGGCTARSNFLEDMWFYVPSSSSALQALEYDPGVYDGSFKYFASMQCDSVSGDWRFWNSAGNTWTVKTSTGGTLPIHPCNLLSKTNSWHHYQLYITMNFTSHTVTYETFVVDGVTVYSDIANTYGAFAISGTPTINIEQQIDNKSTSTVTNSEYLDNYNLSVW
jgi:hypothetical protein